MRYVTYDEDGNLTGCYLQELRPEHINCYLEVGEDILPNWPAYHMNDSLDGIELINQKE